jgi:aromatic amino acid aminotransferase I
MITQLLTKQWGYNGYVRWLCGTFTSIEFLPLIEHYTLGLRTEYTQRRDFFVDCISEQFRLTPVLIASENGPKIWSGKTAYIARPKYEHLKAINRQGRIGGGRTRSKSLDEKMDPEKTILSFVPPTSGMFIWVNWAGLLSFSEAKPSHAD